MEATMTQTLSSTMPHSAAGVSLTGYTFSQLRKSPCIVQRACSYMLDQSQVFSERGRVAITAQPRRRLHWRDD